MLSDITIIVAVVTCVSLIAVAFNLRFFIADDTQVAGWGTWYEIGQRWRSGDFSSLNLHTWQTGNLWAEGQWALLNPVVMVVGLLTSWAPNLAVSTTVVKVLFLCFAAIGAYWLSLTLRSSRPFAILVACLAPLNGFTFYMDTAAWYNGLFTWAFFIWLWLSLVKLQRGQWGLLPAFGFVFLIVSVGYVYSTIMAGLLLGGFVADAALRRQWTSVSRFLVLGIAALMATVPAFLPSILTAPVTLRSSTGIANTGFMGADLSDAALAATLSGGFELQNFVGAIAVTPLFYIAWALPLLALGWRARAHLVADLRPALLAGTAIAMFMLGPTELGPLRMPIRAQPYVALIALVIAAAASMGSRVPQRWSWPTIGKLLALPAIGALFIFADTPADWLVDLAGMTIVMVGLTLTWRLFARYSVGAALTVAVVVLAAATTFQRSTAPAAPLADWNLPTRVADLQRPLTGVRGDTFVVGDVASELPPEAFRETSLANAWLINPQEVQNGYSIIGYRAYSGLLQMYYLGTNKASTLDTLFTTEPVSGLEYVDLFSIENLQMWRSTFPDRDLEDPPPGWKVKQHDRWTVLWSRDDSVQEVGAVAYSSPGTSCGVDENSPDSIDLTVANRALVPGVCILSRLAWPGYRVEGVGALAEPTASMFVTLAVPPGTAATQTRVSFEPPGLRLGIALLLGGFVLVCLVDLRRRRTAVGDA